MRQKEEMGITEYLLLISFILIMFGTFGFDADGKHIDKNVIIGICVAGTGFLTLIIIMIIGVLKVFKDVPEKGINDQKDTHFSGETSYEFQDWMREGSSEG